MSESIVIENAAYAHVSRPPSEPVWWKWWSLEAREGRHSVIAVKARTAFAARACAMVVLGGEPFEVDGERLDPHEEAAMLADESRRFFIGPHDLLFCDLGGWMGGSGDSPFCDRPADAYGEVQITMVDDYMPLPPEFPAAHGEDAP